MERKCISCGLCADICPSKAHRVEDGKHIFDRSKCIKCGKCADVCPGKALIFAYQEWTVQEVADLLLEDKDFYDQSGGGITLSGGECLCQYEFCTAVLKKMKEAGIHCAVDMSHKKRSGVLRPIPIFFCMMSNFGILKNTNNI